jgi:hypothetical protein
VVVFNRLNDENFSYGINIPINLQILQLESHGSQLSVAKKQNISISSETNFIVRGFRKSCLKQKKVHAL